MWGEHIDAQKLAPLKEFKEKYETNKDQWYSVRGHVQKDDSQDSGDITITTQFPLLSPGDKEGSITSLRVRKDYEGNLPSLGFSCPGYQDAGLNLDDRDIKNGIIDIGIVTLRKLP